jgi:hypothetical protein
VIVDGQERLSRWESESNEIEDFLNTMKSLMSTESMVAAVETLVQSELEGTSNSITDGSDSEVDYSEGTRASYEPIEVESYEDNRRD